MPNLLTITWEDDRMLVLFAKAQNGSIFVEQTRILTIPLNFTPEGNNGSNGKADTINPAISKEFAELVRQLRWTKAETTVILSRSDVEVRPMVFPPVPVDELPDMVRFQAAKEFNGYDPHSPLDYMITNKLENVSRSTLFPALKNSDLKQQSRNSSSPESPKHILASTIRQTTFRSIEKLCEDSGLVLRRIVLRPCEVASLWRRSSGFDSTKTTLFVELDADETSQVVLFQGEPVFMRSPKISCPGDVSHPDFAARLIAELKRTRIAVRNEIQGVTVDEVVLCGIGHHFTSLANLVSDGMGISVKTFDPWQGISYEHGAKGDESKKPERFASLIGTAIRAARGEPSDIDFCSPKKRPEPVGKRNLITGIIAASFLALLTLIGYGFLNRSALITEVRVLSNQRDDLKKKSKTVGEQRAQLTAVNTWLADNVNWFDQLDWLSHKAPSAKEMMLSELTLSANNGGAMALKSLVRNSSVISPMEEKMRDEKHLVKAGEKGEVQGNPNYGFRYNLSVFLSKESAASPLDDLKLDNGTTPEPPPETQTPPPDAEPTAKPETPPPNGPPSALPGPKPDTKPESSPNLPGAERKEGTQ